MKRWAFALGLSVLAKTGISAEKALDFEAVAHYQVVIEPGVYGLFVDEKTLYSFSGESAQYVRSIYKPEAKEKDLGFGSLHDPYADSERVPLEPKDKPRRIRNAIRVAGRMAFLDVMNRQFAVYHEERKVWLQPTEIMLDTPKPPRDPRGEPTRAETTALRSRLTKELSRERGNPDLIAGIAELPKSWKDSDGSQYVLWLRGGTSPLLTLRCDKDEFRTCMVQRACFLKGLSRNDYAKITSIAYNSRTDSLLLLQPSEQRILSVTGRSCYSLKVENAYRLPKSLANSQSLFIDKERRLWIGLREAEGSTSASVFVWKASSW